jgi:hypothetical protein
MPKIFSDRINAAVVDGGPAHINRFRDSLMRSIPEVAAEVHGRVLKGLLDDRLAAEDGAAVHAAGDNSVAAGKTLLTPMQAKAATQARDPHLVDNVMKRLSRIGYAHTDMNSLVDEVELTRCMRASATAGMPLSIEQRMEIRSLLW